MSMPSQKPGIARKRTETDRPTLSARLLGRTALVMPTGSPTSHEMSTESTPISALRGPRCRTSSETRSPRKNDRPRLPLAMSFIQCTYWTGSGSLRPRSLMIRARSPGLSLWKPSAPNIATKGSPGRTRMTTKMTIEIPTSVGRPKIRRRRRYLSTPGPVASLVQPGDVPPGHVVNAEDVARLLALDVGVPGVGELLPGYGQERRILLENRLPLADEGSSPALVQLAIDPGDQPLERGVVPLRVVLWSVFAVPRVEVVRRVDQCRDDRADAQVEITALRLLEKGGDLDRPELRLDVERLLEHRLDRNRPELPAGALPDDEVDVPEAGGIPGRGHQAPGFLDCRLGILLIAEPLDHFVPWGRPLGEGVDEASQQVGCRLLDDVDECVTIEGPVHRPANSGVAEGLVPRVDPDRVDDALVVGRARHPGLLLGSSERRRIDDARVVELAAEQRSPQLRRERREVVDGQTVQIREGGVPVVRVPLHEPDFVLLSRDVPERAGPWVVRGLSKVVVVLLQGLLADDDVPAAGEGREHKATRPGFLESELDLVGTEHANLAHGGEERSAWNYDPRRGPDDPGERRLHVLCGEEIGRA